MKKIVAITAVLLVLGLFGSAFILEASFTASRATARTPAQQQFTLSINSVEVIEGDQGTTDAVFTVTLSPAPFFTVRVDYATADNTAIAGSDYTPASGTLTFAGGGNPTTTISVAVVGDILVEAPETFFVLLRNPRPSEYVAIGTGAGTCTIVSNDTGSPALTIFGVVVDEGDGGNTNAVFRVALNRAVTSDVRIDYDIENFSAVAGRDFFRPPEPDTLTIRAGLVSADIMIAVAGDALPELTERFFVKLKNARGGDVTIADGEAVCEIRDDDDPGTITVCSNDTPVENPPGVNNNSVESNIRIDRDLIIDDAEVRLFASRVPRQNDTNVVRYYAELIRDVEPGISRFSGSLFARLNVPVGSSIGTTCSPLPNCILANDSVLDIQNSESPYVGRWRTDLQYPDVLYGHQDIEGLNARGTWRLRVTHVNSTSPGVTVTRLECWCLSIAGPREGLRIEPSRATISVFKGLDDANDRADGDIGTLTLVAKVNSDGGPVARLPVTFSVRDQTGRVLEFDGSNVVGTDERGWAKFEYRNWVPGEHTIEARAVVNGAIYTDIARVTWSNPCTATASVQGAPNAEATLNAMRSFRDSKLATSKRGRNYTQIYYKFSPEVVRMMLFNPMMMLRSQEMIERYMPVVRDMAEGRGVVITEGDLDEIEGFLNAFAARGGLELKRTVKELREDLRNVEAHKELGVSIRPGPKRELPGRNKLLSIKQVGAVTTLFGLLLMLGYCAAASRKRMSGVPPVYEQQAATRRNSDTEVEE